MMATAHVVGDGTIAPAGAHRGTQGRASKSPNSDGEMHSRTLRSLASPLQESRRRTFPEAIINLPPVKNLTC
jgi:hypothetical protein